jgi:uncharacterized protein (DUF488 family)
MSCDVKGIVHTVGHSTRTIEALVELLKAHRIELLVDVRRWPASRRYPHFHRQALAASLKDQAIGYIWRGDLGGFRKPAPNSQNTAWKVGAFRAYADFMLTPEFEQIMNDMEAEAVPWRCHRQLLADAFLVRGFSVRHIMDAGCHEHRLPPFAIAEDRKISYPASSQFELIKRL